MTTRLTLRPWRFPPAIPVAAACICPDRIAGLSRREVAMLPVLVGNRAEPLGDLFEIEGEGSEEIFVEGDLSTWTLIGAGMTRGRLTVRGPVGPRLGSAMGGGTLTVAGDAGARAGEGMRGGALIVGGSAGDHLAAPLPGRPHGLQGGVIVVRGAAGVMAGFRMRRGTCVIGGAAGPGAGTAMLAGTLFILGRPGPGLGALMRRGTIVTAAPCEPLAVFLPSGRGRFPFLRLYADALAAAGAPLPPGTGAAVYRRYTGDISGHGQGEILVPEGPA
jgi:formylmethanofuran dehydrogenase subunit C